MEYLKDFNFTPSEFARFEEIALQKIYQPEEIIIKEGERDRSLMIITKGKAKVVIHHNNQPKIVAKLHSGAIIGELNFTIPLHRSADVLAEEETEAIILHYKELCTLLENDETIAKKFFHGINLLLIERIKAML
ncbi:cyclic nucleotide-binding domain-containing protein [bacterium]|nr:cyclic nucleotide-binding domain-containing protein [bacterium]